MLLSAVATPSMPF